MASMAGKMICAAGAAVLMSLAPTAGSAGPIEKACLSSARSAGNPALCGCIQDAADRTLSPGDQKLAASFFADPHRAQEIRQSSSSRHAAFWQRYRSFGETAEAFCKG